MSAPVSLVQEVRASPPNPPSSTPLARPPVVRASALRPGGQVRDMMRPAPVAASLQGGGLAGLGAADVDTSVSGKATAKRSLIASGVPVTGDYADVIRGQAGFAFGPKQMPGQGYAATSYPYSTKMMIIGATLSGMPVLAGLGATPEGTAIVSGWDSGKPGCGCRQSGGICGTFGIGRMDAGDRQNFINKGFMEVLKRLPTDVELREWAFTEICALDTLVSALRECGSDACHPPARANTLHDNDAAKNRMANMEVLRGIVAEVYLAVTKAQPSASDLSGWMDTTAKIPGISSILDGNPTAFRAAAPTVRSLVAAAIQKSFDALESARQSKYVVTGGGSGGSAVILDKSTGIQNIRDELAKGNTRGGSLARRTPDATRDTVPGGSGSGAMVVGGLVLGGLVLWAVSRRG